MIKPNDERLSRPLYEWDPSDPGRVEADALWRGFSIGMLGQDLTPLFPWRNHSCDWNIVASVDNQPIKDTEADIRCQRVAAALPTLHGYTRGFRDTVADFMDLTGWTMVITGQACFEVFHQGRKPAVEDRSTIDADHGTTPPRRAIRLEMLPEGTYKVGKRHFRQTVPPATSGGEPTVVTIPRHSIAAFTLPSSRRRQVAAAVRHYGPLIRCSAPPARSTGLAGGWLYL